MKDHLSSKSYGQNTAEESEINIKQLIEQYAYYWKWFIISLIFCVTAAFLYLRYSHDIYEIKTKILLQDEDNASGELAGLGEISDLVGVSKGGAFVSDQIEIMKSRRILRKVIQKHDLHIQYRNLGNIKNSEILEEQSPLKLMLLNSDAALLDSIEYAFTAVIQDEETVHIQDEKK